MLQKVKKSEMNIHLTVNKLSHLIFIKSLESLECRHNYPHFLRDEDTETQRGEIILPRLLMPVLSTKIKIQICQKVLSLIPIENKQLALDLHLL